MSGIAGRIRLDGRPTERAVVERMTDILQHRGPDAGDVWVGPEAELGHRMLWTTPESLQERLPLVDPDGMYVLSSDARLDNREDLGHKLGLRSRLSELADSELILAAYKRWEENCAVHLLGDFAFAIWDARKKRLFCARDAVGVKPFYYYHSPGRVFVFASEIKALFCAGEVTRRLNESKISDYLLSDAEDKVATFYEDVYRLPPAHSLSLSRDGIAIREYWALDPHIELHLSSPAEYAEAFKELVIEAVRCRLRSAYPVSVALSGGLDSSTIVAAAREIRNSSSSPPLSTVSCVFDDVQESDERHFIDLLAGVDGMPAHYVRPDTRSALHDIDRMLWHQDQPLYIRNLFLLNCMYEEAGRQGVRVLLDGEDGDTVVSKGYHIFMDLARRGDWEAFSKLANAPPLSYYSHFEVPRTFWLWRFGLPHLKQLALQNRWFAFARGVNGAATSFDIPRHKLAIDYGLRPAAPLPLRKIWRRLRGRSGSNETQPRSLVSAELAERVDSLRRHADLHARYATARSYRDGHWKALTAGSASSLMEEDDKSSAAYGIEKRHPYYDRRVMEFCLALPDEMRIHDGWPRWIQRQAFDGLLPSEIQWRMDKGDLGFNFRRSLLDYERKRIEAIIERPDGLSAYVNMTTLRNAYEKGEASVVWAPVVLALWLDSQSVGGAGEAKVSGALGKS